MNLNIVDIKDDRTSKFAICKNELFSPSGIAPDLLGYLRKNSMLLLSTKEFCY